MRENQSTESIIQNLKDAGCDSDTIENFMADLQKGKEANGLKRLAVHRKNLLDSLHREQKCIDCLDYFVYQMKEAKK
ncbi:MAG: hypothetical protein K2K54_12610 [Lachnospiraceae bacterium]|nr:hypothetical protein [Lachnospiraceae bacterium]